MSKLEEEMDFEEDTLEEEPLDIEEEEPEENLGDEDDLLKDDDDFYDDDFGGDFGGGPPALEKHSDLLKELTNFTPYLRDTVNGWLGLVWNEQDNKYIQNPDTPPIMNKKCAAWCISFLKTYARKTNIITHIGKNEYIYIVQDIVDTIWKNIGTRAEEFGINTSGDVLRICNELQHSSELVLMGAGDGKYNELLSTTTQRSESLTRRQDNEPNMQQIQQNTNAMDRLKNFLGGK